MTTLPPTDRILDSRDWLSDVMPTDENSVAVVLLLLLDNEIQSAQIALAEFLTAAQELQANDHDLGSPERHYLFLLPFHQAKVFVGSVRRAVEVFKGMIFDKRAAIYPKGMSREIRALWTDQNDKALFQPYVDTRNAIEHKWEELTKQAGKGVSILQLFGNRLEFAPGKSANVSSAPIDRLIVARQALADIYRHAWPSGGRKSYAEKARTGV